MQLGWSSSECGVVLVMVVLVEVVVEECMRFSVSSCSLPW